jgi:hypothetical protein
MILPALHENIEDEDLIVIRDFLGIPSSLPAPRWVERFELPGQKEIQNLIRKREAEAKNLEIEIEETKLRLSAAKKWYRLLFEDGEGLEKIVKDALEELGANVAEVSKEKHDFRVTAPGLPGAVMEIKGTHNTQFSKGALRQLSGWMDEVNFAENVEVKGIFLGNSARKEEPKQRGRLFDQNIEKFAAVKGIVILRSMDLFCLVVLKQLNRLDTSMFWKDFWSCKGEFDAKDFWSRLPEPFNILVSDSKVPDKDISP